MFFFFQAEDGIRDFHVTGVQTCALPIWSAGTAASPGASPGYGYAATACTSPPPGYARSSRPGCYPSLRGWPRSNPRHASSRFRVLQAEERALPSVRPLLLVDEVEPALVERVEPLVPAHMAHPVAVAGREVEGQHAEPVPVLGARHGRRDALAGLGPLHDHIVVRGDQAATRALRLVLR